ncbi:MAG: hypothetical protein ACD_48C00109G0001, partial [uncultured bacterium]
MPWEKYSSLCLLGTGGHGQVFLASRLVTNRPCVIKMALPGDEATLQREADALMLLPEHPNCIRLLDVGDGYYAMEFFEGAPLHVYFMHHQPLPLFFAVSVLRAIFRGLAHYHAHGLCHDDVSPENVLIRWEDEDAVTVLIDPLIPDPDLPEDMFDGKPEYL